MRSLYKHIIRASASILLMFLLFSCATYNRRIGAYYSQLNDRDYKKANAALDKVKVLHNNRNKLLFLLEKGKIEHLLAQYDSSNYYFNQADLLIEDAKTSAMDVAAGTLINPMMHTYKSEPFEPFMVHYYKAMNYLYLDLPDEAMVEARRISLQNYALEDKTNKRRNRYSDDAFSLIIQGMIYEQGNDLNNAFISYRNAAELYLNNDSSYYAVSIPHQLKHDLVRTAFKMGFSEDAEKYKKQFGITDVPTTQSDGGELVIFWENGLAPIKREKNFFFTLTKDGAGNFIFVDESGSFAIPFDFSSGVSRNDPKLEDLRTFRVAFPKYEEQPLYYRSASVTADGADYKFEKAEDVNALAYATLKQRFAKEMSAALSRLVVKKLAEAAVMPKEGAKYENERIAVATAIQLYSAISEKADTRNWQSLPHTIYYTRIPLQKGTNTLTMTLTGEGKTSHPITLTAEGKGGLQIRNICTLR